MSNPLAKRNLLFGILAVQRNVIDGNALTAALTAWAAAKDKGLAQILREQKTINENQHARLEVETGETFTLEFQVKRDSIRVRGNGRRTGGLNFAPDRFPPGGAIGLFVERGAQPATWAPPKP